MQPLDLFVLKRRHRGCIYLCNHSNMNLLSGSNMKGVSIYEYFFESNKGKHFTLSDRISIEAGIEKGWSFKKIADELGKSPSSVSREVRRHLIFSPHYYDDHSRRKTECIYFSSCSKQGVCGNLSCSSLCSKCRSRKCASSIALTITSSYGLS